MTRPLRSIATSAAASPATTLGDSDVDEHGEDTEHEAAAQERELEIVARPLTAPTLVSEGEPPVHRGVPGGAEREGRDEGDQRVQAGDPDQEREHRQEHAEPAEADEAELPDPRGTGDVEEQRPEVSQVKDSLASGGLAHAFGSGRLGHRHVDDAQVGNANEQLEQDLETDGTELDPVDQRTAAEEEARKGIRALARLLEQQPATTVASRLTRRRTGVPRPSWLPPGA